MRRALLLDTETPGLDPVTEHVIEVAACVFDLDLGCPIESYASLMRAPANPSERVNRIPMAAVGLARRPSEVWVRVAELAREVDAVAAHNAAFDKSFVDAAARALQQGGPDAERESVMAGEVLSGALAGKPWCCTMDDFQWEGGSKKLVEIALGYGLGVASAHRALADVDTMARIFARVKELGADLPALFRRAARPKMLFYAVVSYERRQVAKEHGFRWDEPKHGKNWFRHMVPEDTRELPFPVRQVS